MDATEQMNGLADELAQLGKIRSSQWRKVFARTPRHLFLPNFYKRIDRSGATLWQEIDATDRRAWLEAVYANLTYVTALDPATARQVPGGWNGVPTSSSTLPGVMASMLEQLDVRDGMRVLEIGTGTGYNAALLCERLGAAHVVTVDIDPRLVQTAQTRLDAAGYRPTVAVADGVDGYPAGAPYDRIIATCSTPSIPPAWLKQVQPGGVVLADIRGGIGGALARVVVADDGTAHGGFPAEGAYFMPMRRQADRYDALVARRAEQAAQVRTTVLDPAVLNDFTFAFVAQLHLPGCQLTGEIDEPSGQAVDVLTGQDGSTARIASGEGTLWHVTEHGPRRLWSLVESAHTWWTSEGEPGWDRFDASIAAEAQCVSYRSTDRPRVWQLAG